MRGDFWVFPFEKIRAGSTIIIHGAGLVGEYYLRQLEATRYCSVLFLVDTFVNSETVLYPTIKKYPIYSVDALENAEYDHIVVATAKRQNELIADLHRRGIHEHRIVNTQHPVSLYIDAPLIDTPNPRNSHAWDSYYQKAEASAEDSYETVLRPILSRHKEINYDIVLDFACGRGRMANIFGSFSRKLVLCDVNQKAIDYCVERFEGYPDCEFEFVVNQTNGFSTSELPFAAKKFSFIYSWDAMVHFSYKWLDYYLSEFYRALAPNGYAIFHHSNYGDVNDGHPKSENFAENVHWRALVTAGDAKFIAEKHGFTVCEQVVTDWYGKDLDCVTLIKKS